MKIAGMTLTDAGYMRDDNEIGGPVSPSETKKEKRYPSLYVDDRELPAVANKEVTDDCLLVALIHVQRRSDEEVNEDGKKTERVNVNFEIRKCAIRPYKSGSDEDEADDGSKLSDEELDEKLKIPASKGK